MHYVTRVPPKACRLCGLGVYHRADPEATVCLRCERNPGRAAHMDKHKRSRYFSLAHMFVDAAVRYGDLPRLDGSIPCTDCGGPATEYEHRDYKKPLEVEPVCKRCNQARGDGENKHAELRKSA